MKLSDGLFLLFLSDLKCYLCSGNLSSSRHWVNKIILRTVFKFFQEFIKRILIFFSSFCIRFAIGINSLLKLLPTDIDSDRITIVDFISRSNTACSLINTINTSTDVDGDVGALVCNVSEFIFFNLGGKLVH